MFVFSLYDQIKECNLDLQISRNDLIFFSRYMKIQKFTFNYISQSKASMREILFLYCIQSSTTFRLLECLDCKRFRKRVVGRSFVLFYFLLQNSSSVVNVFFIFYLLTADYTVKIFEDNRQWFADVCKYKAEERKRPGKAKTYSDIFGMEGSFRKLNVD